MKQYNCLSCNNIFESRKSCKSREPKFCSSKCYGQSLKINIYCKLCNNKIENKHSVGISKRVYCSKNCQTESKKNIKLSDDWKKALSEGRKKSIKCRGENMYHWKGGDNTFKERQTFYYNNRRSAQKIKIDKKHLDKLIYLQDNKCFYCESDLKNYKSIEHLIPISKGGDNNNKNLVYSCKSCNSQKNTSTLKEYAIKKQLPHLILKFEYLYASAIS
jgi:5-methylcytosine-specific restriction endonuclease McrA